MDPFMYNIKIENKAQNQFFLSLKFQHLIPEINSFLIVNSIASQFIILSSGTSNHHHKAFTFSFNSLMQSAESVHQKLHLKQNDRWGLSLPPYHIGGLSIYFRSLLTHQAPAVLHPWNLTNFKDQILKEQVTVLSLVPTQIFDLIKFKISAPPCLKIVLVGGDFLGEELEIRAKNLGWPIIRTFGMTEVGSSLAIGGDLKTGLSILPHHKVKIDKIDRLWVKSHSLFNLQLTKDTEWKMIKASSLLDSNGYYPLEDRASLSPEGIIPLGRIDGSFKSSGHLISYPDLKNILDRFMLENQCWGKMDLLIIDDPRKGKVLCLLHEEDISPEQINDFENLIAPISIDKKQNVTKISRTELGKTKSINF
jgi:O-succinylbenzoic acid--CoA ligase